MYILLTKKQPQWEIYDKNQNPQTPAGWSRQLSFSAILTFPVK